MIRSILRLFAEAVVYEAGDVLGLQVRPYAEASLDAARWGGAVRDLDELCDEHAAAVARAERAEAISGRASEDLTAESLYCNELRAAAQALVDALPKCIVDSCREPATRSAGGFIAYCDAHLGDHQTSHVAPRAKPLRALVALLKPPTPADLGLARPQPSPLASEVSP